MDYYYNRKISLFFLIKNEFRPKINFFLFLLTSLLFELLSRIFHYNSIKKKAIAYTCICVQPEVLLKMNSSKIINTYTFD